MIMEKTKRLVLLALMVSQALVLSLVETWIPVPSVIPGIKLGLANIVTIIVITFFGSRDAFFVVAVRCALSSIFGGGLMLFFFSITGGLLSTTVMSFIHKRLSKYFSITGMSVAGSIAHNIGQIAVACIIMKEISVISYLPVLMLSGIVMGIFIGICGNFLLAAIRKTHILS